MKKITILLLSLFIFTLAFGQKNEDAKQSAKSDKPKQDLTPKRKPKKEDQKYVEYTNKGTKNAQEGDYKSALKEFDKALKEKPDYMEALFDRGTVKVKLMDYAGALADFDAVLKIKPGFPSALINRAAARGYLKDYAGAQGDLDQLIETRPSYAKAYTLRGQMKQKQKDRDGACDDFAKAMEYGDNSSEKIVHLLCSGKFSRGKIVPKVESYSFDWPDTSGWKSADTTKGNSSQLIKFTKGTETLKNWTELGTILTNKGITNMPVDASMKSVLSEVQSSCPQARLTQIDKNEEDEFPWILFMIECPGKNPISSIYQVIQGNTAQFIIAITMKTQGIEAETQDVWKDIFSKGKVEYK